jgi:hypothetical protein
VLLVVIFVLIVKLFGLSGRVGKLEIELSRVTQSVALDDFLQNEKND